VDGSADVGGDGGVDRRVPGGRDVAEVAHAVGYDSASQFSREYRRLFGAPPARDAHRIRAAQSVPVP